MVTQLASAAVRAFLVAVVVATPSLMLTSGAHDASQIIILIGLIAGAMVFVEYAVTSPSITEFRFAPPYNRIRFAGVALSVVALSIIARGAVEPGPISVFLTELGRTARAVLDFPYSPVRLVILLVPQSTPAPTAEFVAIAAALCYVVSLVMMVSFLLIVRLRGWPVRHGAFNVWMNLPLFDPTRGGDVVHKLQREAGINILLGLLLPFLLPVLVSLLSGLFDSGALLDPRMLIWIICAWALLPACLVIRGIAMRRVAALITAKRRRVYAQSEDALQTV